MYERKNGERDSWQQALEAWTTVLNAPSVQHEPLNDCYISGSCTVLPMHTHTHTLGTERHSACS